MPNPALRQGWVLFDTNVRIQWNPVYKAFHQIRCCGNKETKQIVSSNSNVILMQQTCGQRSVMSVGGKRRALAFYFSVRTCYMFLISKCRRWSDLGLCMTSGLAKRVPLHIADFRFLNVFGRKIRQNSPVRSGIFFAGPEVMHRPRSHSPLHFDKGNIW